MTELCTHSKFDVMRTLLEVGNVCLHIVPSRAGVDVPFEWRHKPIMVLEIGLNMPVPIPDLQIDEFGVAGTLSFNRAPYKVRVPWRAVFALVRAQDGLGAVFENPPELGKIAQNKAVSEPKTAKKAPFLRVLRGGKS